MSRPEPLDSISNWEVPSGDKPIPEVPETPPEGFVDLRQALSWKPEDDNTWLLGEDRWLCESGSCLWVAQSGIGKSTLLVQAAMTWALGRPLFGIKPREPLKTVIIQAENDRGDLFEMVNGSLSGMGLTESEIDEALGRVFAYESIHRIGNAFIEYAREIIEFYKPHQVIVDPLLSFAGIPVNDQEKMTRFLREMITPLAKETGTLWHLIHHTGKPPRDKKAHDGWTNCDFSYLGAGSSELTNWARAVNVILSVAPGIFKLVLSKRGTRAGATDPVTGDRTTAVYMRHSEHGLAWEQIPETDALRAIEEASLESVARRKPEPLTREELEKILPSRPVTTDQAVSILRDHREGLTEASAKSLLRLAACSGVVHRGDFPKLQKHAGARVFFSLQPFPATFVDDMTRQSIRTVPSV